MQCELAFISFQTLNCFTHWAVRENIYLKVLSLTIRNPSLFMTPVAVQ